MSLAYVNGAFVPLEQAVISPLDRGFLFADAVYEVIPAYGGHPFRLHGHLQRLERSLAAVGIPAPMPPDHWPSLLGRLLEGAEATDAAIYVQISRGAPERRDHRFPAHSTPTVFAMTSALPDTRREREQGLAAITRPDSRWSRCDIKSVALLPNVLLRQEAAVAGSDEAVLVREGRVTEGAASNVFVVRDGRVATPLLDQAILPGVTRAVVLELAGRHATVEERTVTEDELAEADEIWVSSSTKGLLPVTRLDGAPVGSGRPGALYRELIRDFDRLTEAVRAGEG